ncbi:PH domain-containing protein [Candidatus Uhrbacteria bacterium]|nr:PH domain-containing protein [Candidatus Uhrbacteria bacterium]
MMNLDHLPNQQKDEKAELFLRRHWIAVVQLVFMFFLTFILPILLLFAFRETVLDWLSRPLLGPVLAVLLSIYFLGMWVISFVELTDYYLDTWIVTNERVISIEQMGLFKRVASELHLADIQDVTSEMSGVLETLLSYGDVIVQTSSAAIKFHFKAIDNPEQVKHQILRLVEQDRARHGPGAMARQAPPPVQEIKL